MSQLLGYTSQGITLKLKNIFMPDQIQKKIEAIDLPSTGKSWLQTWCLEKLIDLGRYELAAACSTCEKVIQQTNKIVHCIRLLGL